MKKKKQYPKPKVNEEVTKYYLILKVKYKVSKNNIRTGNQVKEKHFQNKQNTLSKTSENKNVMNINQDNLKQKI